MKGFKVDNKTVPLSPKYNEGFICWEESSFKVACLVILLFTRRKKKSRTVTWKRQCRFRN